MLEKLGLNKLAKNVKSGFEEWKSKASSKFTDWGNSFKVKFQEGWQQTKKGWGEIGDAIQGKGSNLTKPSKHPWADPSRPVILLINGIPYTFPHSWVRESYNASNSFQYSTHPNDPIILIPQDRTITINIDIPLGIPSLTTRYTVVKNMIKTTTLMFGTTNTYVNGDSIRAGSMISAFHAFRFPFRFPPLKPMEKEVLPEGGEGKEESINDLTVCAEEKGYKFKEMSDEQKQEVIACAKEKLKDRKEEAKKLEEARKQKELEEKQARCAEEKRVLALTPEQRQEESDNKFYNQAVENIQKFMLNKSTKSKLKRSNEKVRKFFKKIGSMFKRGEDGIIPFTKLGIPWQVQISCGYFGRSIQIPCCALTGFSIEDEEGGVGFERWTISLIAYNFRKHTETDTTPEEPEEEEAPNTISPPPVWRISKKDFNTLEPPKVGDVGISEECKDVQQGVVSDEPKVQSTEAINQKVNDNLTEKPTPQSTPPAPTSPPKPTPAKPQPPAKPQQSQAVQQAVQKKPAVNANPKIHHPPKTTLQRSMGTTIECTRNTFLKIKVLPESCGDFQYSLLGTQAGGILTNKKSGVKYIVDHLGNIKLKKGIIVGQAHFTHGFDLEKITLYR